MRIGRLALVSLGFVFVLAAPVAAQSCEEALDLDTALVQADSVFVARVIAVSDEGASATAAVEGVWKGPDLEQTVNLDGGDSADKVSGRTRIHQVGQRYLVVASWSRVAFNDDLCTATRLFNGLATEIPGQYQEAVGAEQARSPLPGEPAADAASDGGLPLRSIALGALVLVLVVTVVFLVRRAVAFRPVLTESDFLPKKPAATEELPRPTRRRLAGATSRFSRTGRKQVKRLKSRRRGDRG